MSTVVYLACPITKGDRNWNFFQSCRAQEILMKKGYAVIAPGLSIMHPNEQNMTHYTWLRSCLPVVERCDWLIRLPGESDGADQEVAHAKKHSIPVMFIDHVNQLERVGDANEYQASEPTNAGRNSAAELGAEVFKAYKNLGKQSEFDAHRSGADFRAGRQHAAASDSIWE